MMRLRTTRRSLTSIKFSRLSNHLTYYDFKFIREIIELNKRIELKELEMKNKNQTKKDLKEELKAAIQENFKYFLSDFEEVLSKV